MKDQILLLLLLLALVTGRASGQEPPLGWPAAGNERAEEMLEAFSGKGVMRDDSPLTPPEHAVSRFELRDGLELDLVAHEPEISQPLFLSWDSRGRMWVVQYRQYQYPAGLKVVQLDQYLRVVFDKIPQPPPAGVAGADRITVLEDTDGDGNYDRSKDVLTGLNIATSVQVGPRGIWVLNPPYLLHYPDADGDDIPDAAPEVHLSGFGLQDTHSVANSLMWGPDGWLYGANGSTTGGTISSAVTKGVRFEGQCVWRYHPKSQVFEIYAEGGGNTFSLEIDSKGRVFSGTNSGNKRGYYYPQGSYHDKNWGKHGPLTNPYAFGYFTGMEMEGDPRRFAQAFLIYEGGLFPKQYDHTIVAPNSLHNLVWNSRLVPDGSNYRTVDEENILESDDRWFRPVYGGVGPDGAIYIADWCDTRLSHVSPVDDWHKESGRIYRVRPEGSQTAYRGGDLSQLSGGELIAKFSDPNKWVRRRASLELGWRGDSEVLDHEVLRKLIDQVEREGTLEALWSLQLQGQLTTERAVRWLQHPSPHVRRWTVRLLGDRHESHPALVELARSEGDVQVRSQLAATAKRLDAASGLGVVGALSESAEDLADPHLPLLCWWAVEAHADDWPVVREWLTDESLWDRPWVREYLLVRLMQRYAAHGNPENLQRCSELVEMAPDAPTQELLLAGLDKAFQGRSMPELPPHLDKAVRQFQASRGEAGVVLALRSGREDAVTDALAVLGNPSTPLGIRIELVRVLGELDFARAVEPLLRLATAQGTDEPALQRAAIAALARYDDARIPGALIGNFYGRISNAHDLRPTACRTLASRRAWALKLLEEVHQWRLKPADVPPDVIQQLRTYADPEMVGKVEQAFGKAVTVTSQQKRAEIQRLSSLLSGPRSDAGAGKLHFDKLCATCHQLFGEGKNLGPPLDGYERGNLTFWLNS